MEVKVYDDLLPEKVFNKIVQTVKTPTFGWHYNETVTYSAINRADMAEKDENFYFTHTLYDWGAPQCPHFNQIFNDIEGYLFEKADIDIKAIVRVKCNLYTRTEKIIQHDMHVDYEYDHIACLFSLNDCNGSTVFENGEKIESVANRLIVFNGNQKHASTTCTNQKSRININFNLL